MHSDYFSLKRCKHILFFFGSEDKAYCDKKQSLPKPTVWVQVSVTAGEAVESTTFNHIFNSFPFKEALG